MIQTSSTDHGSSACFLTPLANARAFRPTPSIAASMRSATGSGRRTRLGLRRSKKLVEVSPRAVFWEAVLDADAARAGGGATTGASAPPASASDARRRKVVVRIPEGSVSDSDSASLDRGGRT